MRKLYGFAAILSYSRMRFVTFVKRCDTPTLLRCFMEACEYFGGLPKAALTDRMKSVLLEMDGKVPKWNPVFSDARGLYRHGTTRVQGVHTTNQWQQLASPPSRPWRHLTSPSNRVSRNGCSGNWLIYRLSRPLPTWSF